MTPLFTQAEIEEFGELLDIARLLLERAANGEIDLAWREDYDRLQARRLLFVAVIYGRLNPTGDSP